MSLTLWAGPPNMGDFSRMSAPLEKVEGPATTSAAGPSPERTGCQVVWVPGSSSSEYRDVLLVSGARTNEMMVSTLSPTR